MATTPEIKKIEIDQESLRNLNTTRKWAMFIAIVGFIFLGLIIIIGLITGTFLFFMDTENSGSGIQGIIMLVIFVILAVGYFFPLFFLYSFSKHTALAIETLDKKMLNKAFKRLKAYFLYLGLLFILILAGYLVALILTGSATIIPNGTVY